MFRYRKPVISLGYQKPFAAFRQKLGGMACEPEEVVGTASMSLGCPGTAGLGCVAVCRTVNVGADDVTAQSFIDQTFHSVVPAATG